MALGGGGVVGSPGVGTEDGHPTQEEEDHDDHEHTYHPLLGHQVGRGTAAPDAADPAAAASGEPLQLEGPRMRPRGLGLLKVTPIAVLIRAAATAARCPFCMDK